MGADVEIKALSPLLNARHFHVTSGPHRHVPTRLPSQAPLLHELDPEAWGPGAMLLCHWSPGILKAESPAVPQATLLPKQESTP